MLKSRSIRRPKVSVRDYSFRQLLETYACTDCRLCVDVCPAVAAAGDGRLSGVYRLDRLRKMIRSRAGIWARLFSKGKLSDDYLEEFSNTVFRCTLCGGCQEVCPVGINLRDLWCSIRTDLVGEGEYPEKINMIRDNLQENRNVFGEENDERAEWVEDLRDPPDDLYIRDSAEVVYFVGCTSAFFPLAQKIPMALAEVFDSSGVDFTLLGEDEWCCGFPLIGAGLKDMSREMIDHNMEAIRERGAKKVVFACPSCYNTWREFYPQEFAIYHASEFLVELRKKGALNLKHEPIKVTYHDPCDLGRGARVFDAPREIINSISGVELVEMENNKENCRCCGGGGNLEMIDPELSAKITSGKIDEIMKTGAGAVVTSCQQCVRTMTTFVRRNNIDLEVLDVTQLIRRSIK